MSPTPEPTIVLNQIVSSADSAPWWGVPAIAGAFLLIGGLLTYIYTRHTERTKAQRAQQEKWDEDLLLTGLALLAEGERVRNVALLTLRRTPSESLNLITEQGMSLVDGFTKASRRFSITMPQHFQGDYDGYIMWTLMLVTPPFQRPGQELALQRQVEFERALVTRLRATRRLSPLSFPSAPEFGKLDAETILAQGLKQDREGLSE